MEILRDHMIWDAGFEQVIRDLQNNLRDFIRHPRIRDIFGKYTCQGKFCGTTGTNDLGRRFRCTPVTFLHLAHPPVQPVAPASPISYLPNSVLTERETAVKTRSIIFTEILQSHPRLFTDPPRLFRQRCTVVESPCPAAAARRCANHDESERSNGLRPSGGQIVVK